MILFLRLYVKKSDSMNIVESTTNDRNDEIVRLFNKIKPFLDQGMSYNQAYEYVTNKKPRSSRAWWRDLIKYGEKQGYPRRVSSNANKYGLLNVQFSKKQRKWYYHYDVDGKRKYLTSYDLLKLRKKVEDKKMPWIVLNAKTAQETYNLNDELQHERELNRKNFLGTGKPNKTGILYVSKLKKSTYKNGFFWRYFSRKDDIYISARTLRELRDKVLKAGYPWYVLDEEKYLKYLDEEDVRMCEN